MKTKKIMGAFFGLAALSLMLFAFTSGKGGDSFEIYLNKKLVVQQYLHGDKAVKMVELQQSNYNDELTVKYSHCGRVGQGRTITIKDGQNKVVKQWRFADGSKSAVGMTIKVRDILDLKNKSTVLQLVYSANELPKGYVLASISTKNNSQAKL